LSIVPNLFEIMVLHLPTWKYTIIRSILIGYAVHYEYKISLLLLREYVRLPLIVGCSNSIRTSLLWQIEQKFDIKQAISVKKRNIFGEKPDLQ